MSQYKEIKISSSEMSQYSCVSRNSDGLYAKVFIDDKGVMHKKW